MKENPGQMIKPYSAYFSGAAAIYHNALPHFNNGVIDITTLGEDGTQLAYECIDRLLSSNAFSREIEVDFKTNDVLSHLFFEAKNVQKNKGQQTLGFGYPLFIGQQNNELVFVPLFIWPFQIEASNKQSNWKLKYLEDRPAKLNPYFAHFMMLNFGKNVVEDLTEQFNGGINTEKLASFCNQLAEDHHWEINSQQVSVMPCPPTEALECFYDQGAIQWSGVLGNFPFIPPQNETSKISEYLRQQPEELNNHSFGMGQLDPWKASALANIEKQFITVVEGATGSGKTHLLKYLTTNALANGSKCLIVSEHLEPLKDLQQNFSVNKFEALLFLLRDEINDKVLLSELLKARAKSKSPAGRDMPADYRILSDRLYREKQKMEARYKASRKKVFGNKNWAETVGLFLEASQLEPKELLNSHLDELDYKFTKKELEEIVVAIANAPVLFEKIGNLNHPLTILNSAIFLHHNEEEALAFIKTHLTTFSEKATDIQHRFIHLQNDYAESLKTHYNKYFHELRNITVALKDKIGDYTSHFGSELRKSGKGTLKLYGIFSDKFRQALSRREEIFEQYKQLQSVFGEHHYFEHFFEKSDKTIDKLGENLGQFEQRLNEWRQKQNDNTRDELLRLTHKTAHPGLEFTSRLKELEDSMDDFLEELNETGLYQLPIQCTTLTLQRKQKFLEDKMSVLEQTSYHLRDFSNFYPWHKFWFNQSALSRKVIKALIRINPGNWEAAFKSWYFHKALSLAYDPDLPVSDYTLADFHEGQEELSTKTGEEIIRTWTKRRYQKMEALRNTTESFNPKTLSIKTMLQQSAEVITDFLPLILATPQMAANFGKEEKIFDYLLIDEAQNNFAEASATLFPLAKRVVVFTNPLEEIVGASTLPQVLRTAGINTFSLNYPYGSRTINSSLVEAERINGRFDEDSGTNNDEAEKVIHFLNTIQKTSARTFPSVGIVCFSRQQRDLISNHLLSIKQRRLTGVETIQQLERNGLGVFHFDELSGHHFDLVILSGTFGETGVKNQLSRKINVLNTPEGIAGLYTLLGCAKHKFHTIHSIPQKVLKSFMEQPEQEGTYLLAKFLTSSKEAKIQTPVKEDKFSIETERTLRSENPKASFRKEDNYLIMKDPETGIDQLLLTDGCFAGTPNTDFSWEYLQRKEWEDKGIEIMPVWSVNWWSGNRG
jgi:hypothetical protein